MSYNTKSNRTKRINGSVSIAGKIALFVQRMDVTYDANKQQRDFMGNGESVFTLNGDVVGDFSFDLKNTVDLYDPATTPTLDETISKWIKAIDDSEPSIINFIQTFNAPKSPGSKFARIIFDGRVMTPKIAMSVGEGVDDSSVSGEILADTTSAKREAS